MTAAATAPVYEWPPVDTARPRSHAEESELGRLLGTWERTTARIHALGVDMRRARPDPVRPAARDVLAAYQRFLDDPDGDLDIIRDALTELLEALGDG